MLQTGCHLGGCSVGEAVGLAADPGNPAVPDRGCMASAVVLNLLEDMEVRLFPDASANVTCIVFLSKSEFALRDFPAWACSPERVNVQLCIPSTLLCLLSPSLSLLVQCYHPGPQLQSVLALTCAWLP